MGSKHDKHLLILLYKGLLQEQYPASRFEIEFEPRYYVYPALPYFPDIAIYYHNDIVLWVEVGKLDYDKAKKVIDYIGEKKFLHVPYSHRVFSLNNHINIIDMSVTNVSSFYREARIREIAAIEKAFKQVKGSKIKAAELLGITIDSLKYKCKKFNI